MFSGKSPTGRYPQYSPGTEYPGQGTGRLYQYKRDCVHHQKRRDRYQELNYPGCVGERCRHRCICVYRAPWCTFTFSMNRDRCFTLSRPWLSWGVRFALPRPPVLGISHFRFCCIRHSVGSVLHLLRNSSPSRSHERTAVGVLQWFRQQSPPVSVTCLRAPRQGNRHPDHRKRSDCGGGDDRLHRGAVPQYLS